MELTERKKKVLRSVVDLYIRTAEPVGSKALTELPDMKYSSATIRNEMAELTAMGYLEQPHTSAGRIPSPAGYRLYVDELMADYRLSMDETSSINNAIEEKMQHVDKMMEKVAKLVSQATDLPAIPVNVTEGDLKILGAVLNATLTGLMAEAFTPELLQRVMNAAGAASSLVPIVMEFTTHTLSQQAGTNVAVAGQLRLLEQPEYQDVGKAQKVLTTLDEEALSNLPAVMQNAHGTQVLVGPENVAQELKDTSVVVTKFDIGDGMQGMIGVVGPTRMDYAKVTARLSYFAESLSKMFAKPEQPQLPQGQEPQSETQEA